ncbi:kinase-like domain-containing protein [Suillus subaureus]|uniref:Kinase-like domain-containing protein n=1 Tax=Suillus subaureus TaxID=48587 RepID=A0A9P7DUB3_9AGAM|nr:kinase-like domain-containing protein [Suillus subaureus]KAG1803248.1 kinase-like domain-containing protein [Suillus subaureus]
MGDLPSEPVQFKIEPFHIPGTNIRRARGHLEMFDDYTVWNTTPFSDVSTLQRIRRETYVWIQLEHDHILPLEGVTVAEEFGPLPALVSPWMEEGSLDDYLKRGFPGLSEYGKRGLIWQVAAGISYLHSKGIVHGDLTATNVLVDSSGCLRLADFGLSMILAEAGNATFNSCHPGNVRWMPPEALRAGAEDEDEDEAKDEKPTKAWDVYSYGCVAMQIFSGNQPYAWIKNALKVMGAMQGGRVPFKDIQSHEVYQQLSPCLNKIPANRPTMVDIMRDLGLR